MKSRLLQVFLPSGADPEWEGVLEDVDVLGSWKDASGENQCIIHLLLPADQTEGVMDRLEGAYGGEEGFAIILLAVEASIPRPENEHDSEPEDGSAEQESKQVAGRVSREELYNDVTESIDINRSFVALVGLSAIVAAFGLLRNDVAVIIGAMVIAPLLGPNVAMSLAATLGDRDLLIRAVRASALGLVIALGISVLIGLLFDVDPTVPELARRTEFGVADLMLALAAGSAGTFAFTSGLAGAVIGVMVAVALVPPLVAGGLLLGSGSMSGAYGAFLLATANMASINLAGVATFLAQGVAPRTWWEEKNARSMTRRAVIVWCAMIALLVGAFLIRTYVGIGA